MKLDVATHTDMKEHDMQVQNGIVHKQNGQGRSHEYMSRQEEWQ